MSKFLDIISENTPDESFDDAVSDKFSLVRMIIADGDNGFAAMPKKGLGPTTIKTPGGFEFELTYVGKIKQEEAEDGIDVDSAVEKMADEDDDIKKAVEDRKNILPKIKSRLNDYKQTTLNINKALQ